MADEARFDWQDPFLFNDQLSEEERMLSASAAEFARRSLMPRVEEAYLHEKTDPAVFREMERPGFSA